MGTVDLSRFSAKDVREVTNWTLLSRAMIGQNPDENPAIMIDALDEITERVNSRWPLGAGESMQIDPADLDADLSAFSESVAVAFTARTMVALFSGIDGPHATANVLKGAIQTLAAAYE